MLSSQKREYVYYRDQSSYRSRRKNKSEGYILNINGNNGTITFRPENVNLPIPESSEVVVNELLRPSEPAVDYNF
jgi:hypothetical protein